MLAMSGAWQGPSTGLNWLQAGSAEDVLRDLPNFHKVDDNVYRGGQPSLLGLKKLRELGIKTVINFRGESKETSAAEKKVATELGMSYVNIPLSAWRPPTPKEIAEFLGLLNNKADGPVFVHCRRGADRTGAMIAIYRITTSSWAADRAYGEMREFGFSRLYQRLKHFVYNFEKDWRASKDKALAANAGANVVKEAAAVKDAK
jgi:uncharacterized protein (TIGR01244 family)